MSTSVLLSALPPSTVIPKSIISTGKTTTVVPTPTIRKEITAITKPVVITVTPPAAPQTNPVLATKANRAAMDIVNAIADAAEAKENKEMEEEGAIERGVDEEEDVNAAYTAALKYADDERDAVQAQEAKDLGISLKEYKRQLAAEEATQEAAEIAHTKALKKAIKGKGKAIRQHRPEDNPDASPPKGRSHARNQSTGDGMIESGGRSIRETKPVRPDPAAVLRKLKAESLYAFTRRLYRKGFINVILARARCRRTTSAYLDCNRALLSALIETIAERVFQVVTHGGTKSNALMTDANVQAALESLDIKTYGIALLGKNTPRVPPAAIAKRKAKAAKEKRAAKKAMKAAKNASHIQAYKQSKAAEHEQEEEQEDENMEDRTEADALLAELD
jgi:hypothetical protein